MVEVVVLLLNRRVRGKGCKGPPPLQEELQQEEEAVSSPLPLEQGLEHRVKVSPRVKKALPPALEAQPVASGCKASLLLPVIVLARQEQEEGEVAAVVLVLVQGCGLWVKGSKGTRRTSHPSQNPAPQLQYQRMWPTLSDRVRALPPSSPCLLVPPHLLVRMGHQPRLVPQPRQQQHRQQQQQHRRW